MNLKEYIDWHKELGYDGVYNISPELADPTAVGFKKMERVSFPKIQNLYDKGNLGEWRGVNEQYLGITDDKLTLWAQKKWPFLKFVKAKIQIQRPGERVKPHLDFCGDYLRIVSEQIPWLLKVKHTLEKPGIDIWRMSIAMEDQLEGQIFAFNNQNWEWKKGDCIRINTWRALHWTENKSKKDRPILKITGIKFGLKKENNVIA